MATTDFTIADVLAWARTKPASEAYRYTDNCGCAIGQFLREKIDPEAKAYPDEWEDEKGNFHSFPYGLDIAAAGTSAFSERTFGAFVRRLELVSA